MAVNPLEFPSPAANATRETQRECANVTNEIKYATKMLKDFWLCLPGGQTRISTPSGNRPGE